MQLRLGDPAKVIINYGICERVSAECFDAESLESNADVMDTLGRAASDLIRGGLFHMVYPYYGRGWLCLPANPVG
jgi:hypothetical protein